MKACLALMVLLVLPVVTRAEGAASIAGAEAAAGAWLQLVDTGQYARSWQEAAALFKERVTQDQWQARVKAVRESLGALVSRNRTTASSMGTLPGAPDGDYVVLHYATSFTKKQTAVETVTELRAADGAWRMVGYFLR